MAPLRRQQAAEREVAALFDRLYVPLVRSLRAAGYVEPEDAVQEAFVQASLRWRRVREYDDVAAWIRRAAVNRCLNARRSRRRQEAVVHRLSLQPDRASEQSDADPTVIAAIASLPAQQRVAVALFYVGDLPVAQVASAMEISEGAVKYHLHVARETLRRSLEALR